MRMLAPCLTVVLMLLAAAPAAQAQAAKQGGPESAGTFETWKLFTFVEGGKRGCFLFAEPTKKAGAEGRQRGQVALQVTHRPAEKRFDEVSVMAGYPYKEKSESRMSVGAKSFTLFTDREASWAKTPKDDADIVAAMRGGQTLTVKGMSRSGAETTDTYALKGFAEGYQKMSQLCRR
ncbi:MAG: hypothetical protein JNK11_17435 [Alphaproteobacteria bacterium]|nr:hypothetical protein [Alphaproteobacteria bacterium]